jgi:hypothetical protein
MIIEALRGDYVATAETVTPDTTAADAPSAAG